MKRTKIRGRRAEWSPEQQSAMVAMESRFDFSNKEPRQGEEGLEDEGQPPATEKPKRKLGIANTEKPTANPKVAAAREKVREAKRKQEALDRAKNLRKEASDRPEKISYLRTGGITEHEMRRINNFISSWTDQQRASLEKAIARAEDEKALEMIFKRILATAVVKGF